MITKGTNAEKEFSNIFKTELTNDRKLQNQDIDGFLLNGESVSIKHQTCFYMCEAFNFELALEDPKTGEKIPGNFRYNKAKYTAHKAGNNKDGAGDWWVFLTADLKEWFLANKAGCKVLKTTAKTEHSNKTWGAGKYRRSHCAIVHLAKIKHLAVMQFSPTTGKWNQYNSNLVNKEAQVVLTPEQIQVNRVLAEKKKEKSLVVAHNAIASMRNMLLMNGINPKTGKKGA